MSMFFLRTPHRGRKISSRTASYSTITRGVFVSSTSLLVYMDVYSNCLAYRSLLGFDHVALEAYKYGLSHSQVG